ncbi:hypothetical protein [Desulfurivibrio dismutans]|uniref:hypothetical protein n=1 Tax=Desulfurivibrio dismutans TaxID=1398908 RepID=UPI0023DA5AE6|nr:hypothetical protein [Desulfurivibrio alkaliphilus]MDF1614386.1 hypothetical protein [Desulfurivibrio alkaliphilus]
MKRQVEMQECMLRAHRDFLDNLEKSIELVAQDIQDAQGEPQVCTDEWCATAEETLDEMAKLVFSISEPRWLTDEDSKRISNLRRRIHDLYSQYKAVKK